MSYVCLFCATPHANAGNCCRKPRQELKLWSDYSANQGLISLENFVPSCRRISFNLHIDPPNNAVYVVVKVTITYEDGAIGPAWTNGRRQRFARLIKASVGLWDRGVVFTRYQRGGVSAPYNPFFFLDVRTGWFPHEHMQVTAVSSDAPQRLGPNGPGILGELMLAPGAVVLRGPYPDRRPAPTSGSRYSVGVRLNEYAPRSYEGDNLVLPRANRTIVNTMAHEYGHMIGLPDEYDAYPAAFSTANVHGGRVVRGPAHNSDKDKTVAFWVERLAECRIASPAWGHAVPDDSIMRNVDTRAGAFKPRHYVTVLEGLNLMARRNLGRLGGVWSI